MPQAPVATYSSPRKQATARTINRYQIKRPRNITLDPNPSLTHINLSRKNRAFFLVLDNLMDHIKTRVTKYSPIQSCFDVHSPYIKLQVELKQSEDAEDAEKAKRRR